MDLSAEIEIVTPNLPSPLRDGDDSEMDLQASASGYGGGGGYGYIQEEECPEGINVNLALLLIGAAIAAAATALFFQVRLNTELIGSLKLGNVCVLLQLIHRPMRTKKQL